MSTKSPSSPISYMVNFQDLANYGFSLVEDVNIDGHLPKMCDDYKPTLDKNIEAQRQVYKNKFENKSIDYKSKVMKTFCRNGIPPELRGELWFHISGADKLKQESPTLYSDLKKNHNSKEVSEAVKQIDNDIDRTFPEQVFYALDESKTALRNILVAYSLYNKQVGYCQSMNFLAAILHIHMGEENAFYTLVQMLKHQSYLPPTLFDPTLDGLYCETFVLDKLAEKRLSKIYLHLKKLDINFVLFTTKWFMLLYINVFPMETSLRIWDYFFLRRLQGSI
ncbi:TBC protein [Acrasis kona]|uniref:TBC protein n=1 Tax=Acrasis kona TaxID=1008807 RepID=A0AAW2ZID1_9EUKA